MINSIRKLFGIGPKTDFQDLVKQGAVILDVRSKGEYAGGHINGSINIPVNLLLHNLGKINEKNIPIITCCASGMRSASARSILIANGYSRVYNGGPWQSLKRKIM